MAVAASTVSPATAPTAPGIPGAAPVVAEANNGGLQSPPPVSSPAVLTPAQELAAVASGQSAGGQYYGATPNGIADLVNGGLVNPDGTPVPGSSTDATIATSGVQRYTQPSTTPSETGTDVSQDPAVLAAEAAYGANGPTAPDVNAIRQQAMTDAQNEISGIQSSYAPLFAAQASANTISAGKTRAVTARTGVEGQDIGESEINADANAGSAKVSAINDKMNNAIAAAMQKALARGDTLAQQAQSTYDTQESSYLGTLKGAETTSISADSKTAAAAKADLTSLAKAGIPLSSLTPEEYQTLVGQTGMDPSLFNAFYNANLPQNQQRKYTYVKNSDGSVTPVYVDPTTGQPVAETPIEPPGGATQYDKFQVLPDGTAVWINSKTGQAVVAGSNGTNIAGANGQTNFAKSPTGSNGNPPAAQTPADKLGIAFLKQQTSFTALSPTDQQSYLDAYANDPVFHASVNAAAAKAVNTTDSW